MDRKNYLSAILIATLVVEGWLIIGALGGWTVVDAFGWSLVEGGINLAIVVVASIKVFLILASVGSLGLQTLARKAV